MSSHIPDDDTADDRAADDRVASVSGDPDALDRETHRAAGQPIASPQLGSVDVAGLDALGRLLLGSESIASVLHRAASYAHRALSMAQEVSVSLISGGHRASAAWTGLLAFELDECQHGTGYGPCLEAARTGTIVVIEDTATETRWPEFVALAARQGVGSTLSVPIPIGGEAQAALNLYAATAGAFEPLAVAGARHVAGQVAAAIANMHDLETARSEVTNLQAALQTRAGIEQAKGILMAVHGCSAEEAFAILSRESQVTNTKLREVAEQVVAQMRGRSTGP